jgi:SAP domain-containing ribonucleoprotein
MPEYAKMKNADLEALLRERNLPATGKKADMVDRLTKDDEKNAAPAETKAAVNAEDEIDWDDDGDEAAATTTQTDATVTANEETIEKAGGEGRAANPLAVPNQVADIDPAQTDDLTTLPPTEGGEDALLEEEKKEPAPDYTKGLAATNLDEEIERRRKRAEKFGMKVEDDEGLKKLERAKKFGESGPPRGLDEALPERNRKRGREGGDDVGDNKRRGGGRSGPRGGRGGGRDRRDNRDNRDSRDNRDNRDSRDNRDNRDNRNRGDREPRKEQGRSNGGGSWMSEKDKAAAEARKAKWTNSAAS